MTDEDFPQCRPSKHETGPLQRAEIIKSVLTNKTIRNFWYTIQDQLQDSRTSFCWIKQDFPGGIDINMHHRALMHIEKLHLNSTQGSFTKMVILLLYDWRQQANWILFICLCDLKNFRKILILLTNMTNSVHPIKVITNSNSIITHRFCLVQIVFAARHYIIQVCRLYVQVLLRHKNID